MINRLAVKGCLSLCWGDIAQRSHQACSWVHLLKIRSLLKTRGGSVTIKAYDLFNNLIPFASTSVLLSAGQDLSPRFIDIEWASFAGSTGRLRNIFQDSEPNIIASINSSTSIARLVYEFDMNSVNDRTGESLVRFSFAAVPAPPTVAILLVGLACGGFSMWRRRKQV